MAASTINEHSGRSAQPLHARRLMETAREVVDPLVLMQRITDATFGFVAHADGVGLHLVDEQGSLTCVAASGSLESFVGGRLALAASLSGQALAAHQALRCDDTALEPGTDQRAAERHGMRSLVCLPLYQAGEALGVLVTTSEQVGSFTDTDVEALSELGAFVATVVKTASDVVRALPLLEAGVTGCREPGDVPSPSASEDPTGGADLGQAGPGEAVARFVTQVLRPGLTAAASTRRRIENVLARRSFTMVYQPIVDLRSGRMVAVEALARFSGPPALTPDVWFADAEAAGLGVELELAAVDMALRALPELPPQVAMAVNVGPAGICSPALRDMVAAAGPKRVIVELTEHSRIDDYDELTAVRAELRALGARLSVDDTGAGYSSLAHIINLSPDVIKLDLALTRNIDSDLVRRYLAHALVRFASEAGTLLVAEGIETPGELQALRELGITYGQGYHLARPAPLTVLPVATTG